MNKIALQRTVSDIIAEFEEKSAALPETVAAYRDAVKHLDMATCVFGQYGGPIWGKGGAPSLDTSALEKTLLVSGWKAIYDRLQIDRIATAKDKKRWEQTIADPPPLTRENAFETFGDYLMRSRFHILRGLAEAFVDLDPAYKSHSKVKIGVAGLPKRVILTNVGGYGSWGRERLINIVNALAAYRSEKAIEQAEMREIDDLYAFGHKAGEVKLSRREGTVYSNGRDEKVVFPDRGITVRKFKNDNAHVIFDPEALLDINRALAEFYGDVLPDAEEPDAKPRASTAVSKDLAFYPTPAKVIDEILGEVGIYKPEAFSREDRPALRVLEPSCGDGRMMDEIRARGHQVLGYEVHAGRAATARAKGHPVVTGNFLEAMPPGPGHGFDVVVMNPPFYGRHYVKHVRHALLFLKPGGKLVSVLPATAWYDHKELKGLWKDLPVASFAEAGTNVPTGYLIMQAPR